MTKTELVIKCDCKVEDCNLFLVISPLNSVAIYGGNHFITGLHLSEEDANKVAEQLKNNNISIKEGNKKVEKKLEKILNKYRSK